MNYALRPYQQECADEGLDFLQSSDADDGGLLVLPTGSGKSLVIASIATRLPGPCLVFQPSREILEQNLEKLVAYGYSPGVYSASAGSKTTARVTLATIGSVVRKAEDFRWVRYVVIDEAHLVDSKNEGGMFNKFLSVVKPKLLGLTATPYRLSTDGYGGSMLKFLTRTRPRVFKHVVRVVQQCQLYADGYLCPVVYKPARSRFDRGRLVPNSTGADYTDDSVRRHFKEVSFEDFLVRCVQRFLDLGRGPTLAFTRFVEEAEYVASKVAGARVVTAETRPAERRQVIADFKAGLVPAVCNVGVLTVGFDFPALRNVLLGRPTMSLALYYQMVGRGVRPAPGKEDCWVVDAVGLVEQFGKVEDMEVSCGMNGTWYVHSAGRQLTNVYFGDQGRKYAVQSNIQKNLTARGN